MLVFHALILKFIEPRAKTTVSFKQLVQSFSFLRSQALELGACARFNSHVIDWLPLLLKLCLEKKKLNCKCLLLRKKFHLDLKENFYTSSSLPLLYLIFLLVLFLQFGRHMLPVCWHHFLQWVTAVNRNRFRLFWMIFFFIEFEECLICLLTKQSSRNLPSSSLSGFSVFSSCLSSTSENN